MTYWAKMVSPAFIAHTGLASRSGQQKRSAVDVVHMGPPLRTDGQMTADTHGTTRLNDNERRKIENFNDRHAGEHAATRNLTGRALLRRAATLYCIHPHTVRHLEEDGRYARIRFSCAGFVFEAYRKAGITLLDESTMPPVSLDELKRSYSSFSSMLDLPQFRASMGLSGPGEWQVMLCGYLLHALNRNATDIRSTPYVPSETDTYFP